MNTPIPYRLGVPRIACTIDVVVIDASGVDRVALSTNSLAVAEDTARELLAMGERTRIVIR